MTFGILRRSGLVLLGVMLLPSVSAAPSASPDSVEIRGVDDPAPASLVFAPTFPPDGALLEAPHAAPSFTWRPGGFGRFRVEFSSSPDFSRRPYRETSSFRSSTHYEPGERAWDRIQELGRCGRPVYWRVVAKIPGAQGVVSSDRVSWFALEPSRVRIDVAQSQPSIGSGGIPTPLDPNRVVFRVTASSSECGVTESRIDFDGDGWWDASMTHGSHHIVATYDHSYLEPGTFTVRAEILTGSAALGSAHEVVTMTETDLGGLCSDPPGHVPGDASAPSLLAKDSLLDSAGERPMSPMDPMGNDEAETEYEDEILVCGIAQHPLASSAGGFSAALAFAAAPGPLLF